MLTGKGKAVSLAAAQLREDIIKMIDKCQDIPWPPNPTDLAKPERQPPSTLIKFLREMLQPDHHVPGIAVQQYIWSISQDLVHAVSRGKFLTEKHTLLGNSLHTMTGQKLPIEILAKLGNSCSYDMVREIETAQAEVCQKQFGRGDFLPVKPCDPEKHVLTHFWWDNFDCTKENAKGSVHTTHGIAFQEISENTVIHEKTGIERSGKKTPTVLPCELPVININPKRLPTALTMKSEVSSNNDKSKELLFLWKTQRRIHKGELQLIPRFVGWVIQKFGKESTPTVMTFLPPIRNPITEYSTVCETIEQSLKLSKAANMKYTNITTDAGAAEKYYRVLWNNPEKFKTVIIHLGDLHGFMHFFGNIGKYISHSGFEDVVFQAGMCTDGSLKGVISGKSYNKCWNVHEVVSEAIDRLFCDAYMQPMKNVNTRKLKNVLTKNDTEASLSNTIFKNNRKEYEDKKERCLRGEFGITPQYWMVYNSMIGLLHRLHFAINTNDYILRQDMWDQMIALSFSLNKQNYARYGTYYIMQLANLESTHPGAREEIEANGISVCRNVWGIRQSIDAAGEQTFMRDPKTAGGIKNFVSQDCTYEKWVLSRPGQAEYVQALRQQCKLDTNLSNPRKCMRKSEILKLERTVQKVITVFKEDFVNPFWLDLDKKRLYSVCSGSPVSEEIKDCLLSVFERGKTRMIGFKDILCNNSSKNIFSPITREVFKGFSDSNKKTKAKVSGKMQDLSVQKDVLGLLAAKSHECKSVIDIQKSLTYPLAPVSLPLASADGAMRKTNKSSLYDALHGITDHNQVLETFSGEKVYIMDLAATLRSVTKLPRTFGELAEKLWKDVPRPYNTIYVACDTYSEDSIKNSERDKRGSADRLVIRSPQIRIPSNFQNFLNNGENKEQLFELIENVWVQNSEKFGNKTVFFARKDRCRKMTNAGIQSEFVLNHEEADTKVAYLVEHAITNTIDQENSAFVVRSISGDIDIPVIMLACNREGNVFIDNGTRKP